MSLLPINPENAGGFRVFSKLLQISLGDFASLGVSREEITTGLAVDARDAAEELTLFRTIRCETARIVRAMLPNALDRQAVLVAADGAETTRTVQQFLTGITKHVAHHLAFVYEKRRALGLAAPQTL
jgi:hypothetical protein